MTMFNAVSAVRAAFLSLFLIVPTSSVFAAASDYEFQIMAPEIKKGETIIDVQLLDKKTGARVPDAVIFATRLDMEPEGMADMTIDLAPLPTTQPGLYQFKANLNMAGKWQLSLAAKVQGEDDTITNKLIFKATP